MTKSPVSRHSGASAAAFTAVATLSLGACSGGTGDAAAPADENTVTFMNWDPHEGSPMAEAIEQFTAETGIEVDVQPASAGDDYDTRMRTTLASSSPVDVMRINDDFVAQFSENETLLDLSPYIESDIDIEDYAEEAFNFGAQADGRHTAMTVGYVPALVMYNKSMFEEAGVPLPPSDWSAEGWTWEDFLETARALTTDDQWGALITPDTNYEQTFSVNNGSETGLYSEDGTEFTMADPEAVEAVQWVADLTCTEGVQPEWSLLQGDNPGVRMFIEGRIGMLFARTGAIPQMREAITDFDWALAPPPAREAQMTEASVAVFAIPADAPNPDGAWELLKFLAGPEGGEILGSAQAFTPINIEAAATAVSESTMPENQALLVESNSHLTAAPTSPNTLAARQIYRPALDAVYNCEKSAEEVLTGVRPQVEAALAGE